MNKAFEKILEKLEDLQNNLTSQTEGNIDLQIGVINGVMYSKKIVQEVSEEYNDGWIPCSERMPEETEKLYLVTYKKFILGNFRYFMDIAYLSPLPDGTLEWRSEKAPVTRKVEAWQELPEEYKGH